MSISWGDLSVRVYAAKAWISLAPRFAEERPEIVDQIEAILQDEEPAVRLQAAQNLQVICKAAPERMWSMGERIAASEVDERVLASYLARALKRFRHAESQRCERILISVKDRLSAFSDKDGRSLLRECLGGWAAQLYARQGRPMARGWLEEWAADPQRFRDALNAYTSSLRNEFFARYAADAEQGDLDMCDRAQDGLKVILVPALAISAKEHATLTSVNTLEESKSAGERYIAAELVIRHAMNQLYFGAGVRTGGKENELGLSNPKTKSRFLADYAEILGLLQKSREPGTLHHLIELYEYLIPGDPVAVFGAIHSILIGVGAKEGYHYESLGNTTVVKIVKLYIADHRGIFDDPMRRAMLVEILQLFSEAGWPEALRLLYDLPDLFR
ncbi:sister chromatid cohesion protein PDS5 [Xanthomonas arboricola]|uniref:sister chromatid cohesion protein PDS5 n=1 Tax=Xanthomonas arboricola TaxID=56448 RepID=UPI001C615F1B|nr:sister chromatid cohesion protein PDS5 [Xanthomonas arboricola]